MLPCLFNYLNAIVQRHVLRRTTPFGAYQEQLMTNAIVVAHIVMHFIPNKLSFVLKAPGTAKIQSVLNERGRGPQE